MFFSPPRMVVSMGKGTAVLQNGMLYRYCALYFHYNQITVELMNQCFVTIRVQVEYICTFIFLRI